MTLPSFFRFCDWNLDIEACEHFIQKSSQSLQNVKVFHQLELCYYLFFFFMIHNAFMGLGWKTQVEEHQTHKLCIFIVASVSSYLSYRWSDDEKLYRQIICCCKSTTEVAQSLQNGGDNEKDHGRVWFHSVYCEICVPVTPGRRVHQVTPYTLQTHTAEAARDKLSGNVPGQLLLQSCVQKDKCM